jgi:predicted dienelactone hydrolase
MPLGALQGSFRALRGHSIDNAPVADGHFPLVVLEPGMGLSAPMFATLGENLASHGYVVAAVTPTYSANVTVVHGHVRESTPAGNPENITGPDGVRVLNVWVADGKFAAAKTAAQFGGHVDASRTLYMGHSFGGAAALQQCHLDAHCAGAIDLDGTQFGSVTHDGVPAPVMIIGSDGSCTTGTCSPADAEQRRERTVAQTMLLASPHTWCFSIDGTQHFNFTDYAAYFFAPPLNTLIPLGPIDGDRGLAITNHYVVTFADHVLRGGSFPIADPLVRTLHRPHY